MINLRVCSFELPDCLWTVSFQNAFQSAAFISAVLPAPNSQCGSALTFLWNIPPIGGVGTKEKENCSEELVPAREMPKNHFRQFCNLVILTSPRRKASSGTFFIYASLHVNTCFFSLLNASLQLPAQPIQIKYLFLKHLLFSRFSQFLIYKCLGGGTILTV